jgi:hypothetical protein
MATELQDWAPGIEEWPESWQGVDEDLEYGRKLLQYFKDFLWDLMSEGVSRRTFAGYRDDVWVLGGSIIKDVSWNEDYFSDPLSKLKESVEAEGVLPDHWEDMSDAELQSFERTCRRFEKYLRKTYNR